MSIERGCGYRSLGGIYAEVLTGPEGKPVEDFLVDPPIIVDSNDLGLNTHIGVRLIQRQDGSGIFDVYDVIGKTYYPNVADFVEEARNFGISRKLSTRLDLSGLTVRSRLVLLHERAFIHNWHDYHSDYGHCPKSIEEHHANKIMCAKLWWEDLEILPISGKRSGGHQISDRLAERAMPSFTYQALLRPKDVNPHYELAIFGIFPLNRLAVVHDPDGDKHEDGLKKARQSKLPVKLVSE